MDFSFSFGMFLAMVAAVYGLKWLLQNVNGWLYEKHLGSKRFALPPGDLGWPFIGNMWSFLRAFKSNDPDSFVSSFVSRFGQAGFYKAFMFGSPSLIVTTPELCKRVLTDDSGFKPGWPRSTVDLIGKKSFIGISFEEHKRLRRITAAAINGPEALSLYMTFIEENVKASLEKWSTMKELEFLTELRRLTFKIIMHIFLSKESEAVMEILEKEYTTLNHGVRSMAINLPGFAFYKARKARKNLVSALQSIVTERRTKRDFNISWEKNDMMDILMNVEDENGRKLSDEEIIDVLVMYLNAGHESSGHIAMWTTVLLQRHPEYLQMAKAEQQRIIKERPPKQKVLTMKEYRKMEYLSKVIDETLRLITFSPVVFREANEDIDINGTLKNGYIIPKGWKVLVWFRGVHFDPKVYTNPREFNPSRWDSHTPKAGEFLPFGAGSRLCPGNELAKLEISIFLHYFLLDYKLEILNPGCPVRYLPHTRPKDNCLGRILKCSST